MSETNEPIIRHLSFVLTEDELLARGRELARKVREHIDMELAKKAAAKKFKDDLDTLNEEISKLQRTIETGKESRPVQCRWVPIHERALMALMSDLGEEVESRPMDDHDRQRRLFTVGGLARAAAATGDLKKAAHDAAGPGGKVTLVHGGQETVIADRTNEAAPAAAAAAGGGAEPDPPTPPSTTDGDAQS